MTHVAVATNFRTTALALKSAFLAHHDSKITLTAGSTGKLYAQIINSAPYELFLAADQERPQKLIEQGAAVEGSRKTYALGTLALVGNRQVDEKTLVRDDFRSLAIANPKLAPYGVAALQVLQKLDPQERSHNKLVMGENVGQAYALVATGNAELGLVAAAALPTSSTLSRWQIPQYHHQPIYQDMVLLRGVSADSTAAIFAAFIASAEGRQIIADAGYGLPES